jgi:hypothetical protein
MKRREDGEWRLIPSHSEGAVTNVPQLSGAAIAQAVTTVREALVGAAPGAAKDAVTGAVHGALTAVTPEFSCWNRQPTEERWGKGVANRAAERRPTMSDFIQFKTNHGDIWLRPSAVIGVARETTRTTAMRLVDGKVYNVAGSPKDVLDALGASFTSQARKFDGRCGWD